MRRPSAIASRSHSEPFAIPQFDANLLITLALLIKTRSVTRTAAQLGTSQPSVSRALSQLRTLLEDPLLVRTRGGMALTQRAEDLAEPLQQWLTATNNLLEREAFEPAVLTRRFRVASTDFGVLAVIAPAMAEFMRQAPGATIEVVPLKGSMTNELGSGDVDLLVSGLEPDPRQAFEQHLFRDEFACLFRPNHVLARAEGILSLDAFLEWPHIAMAVGDDDFDRADFRLGTAGRTRRVIGRLPYFSVAPTVIAGSDALITLPARAAAQYSALYGLGMRPAPLELGDIDYRLFWHARTDRDPASRWLRDLLAIPFTQSAHESAKAELSICVA